MAAREDILERIRKTLSEEFDCDPSKIVPEARFYEDLDLDSIDAVDLIVRLRKEVDFEIKSDDFKSIRTVGDLLDVLERVSAAAPSK